MKQLSWRNAIIILVASGVFVTQARGVGAPRIRVHRDPDCGCCSGWVRHLEENGFVADVQGDEALPTLREKAGVPLELVGCHTAGVEGYIVEGHVPAAAIHRLLQDVRKPSAFQCRECRQARRGWMARLPAMLRSCSAKTFSPPSCSSKVQRASIEQD